MLGTPYFHERLRINILDEIYATQKFILDDTPKDVCNPSPCGPNSVCRQNNNQAVCSCVPGYSGNPPSCRPECVVNSDCPKNRACLNFKCSNPCTGSCGIGARCNVVNHSPICSCPPQNNGDPFIRCIPIRKNKEQHSCVKIVYSDLATVKMTILILAPTPPPQDKPCEPSPCGPRSQCRVVNNVASCSCLPEFLGSPPNCRPECASNSECPSQLACINYKCKDPCPGSCGVNAECRVISHTPSCRCANGYSGDPFTQCTQEISEHRTSTNERSIFQKTVDTNVHDFFLIF